LQCGERENDRDRERDKERDRERERERNSKRGKVYGVFSTNVEYGPESPDYRVAKMHRMPHLYRLFSAKEP